MSRIPVYSVDNAPQAARERLRELQAQMGKVLNIHGEMAHAPVVLAAYGGIDTDPKLTALLNVARELSGSGGDVDETTWTRAREAGWTDTELTELFTHVIVNVFTNYFNHYAHTALDLPAAPGVTA